jgi:hypothetical protein
VVPGAQYACTVVFEVPTGDTPTQLSYDDQHGDTVAAPVSYTPPPPPSGGCATFVTFPGMSTAACEECKDNGACAPEWQMLYSAVNDGQACPNVATECQSCPMSDASPGYCGCMDGCLGGCRPFFDAYFDCLLLNCATACL